MKNTATAKRTTNPPYSYPAADGDDVLLGAEGAFDAVRHHWTAIGIVPGRTTPLRALVRKTVRAGAVPLYRFNDRPVVRRGDIPRLAAACLAARRVANA